MDWLVWVHPAGMLAVLALGYLAFRDGVQVRRARLTGASFDSRRHRLLGKLFAILATLGFGSGVASMILLRGDPAFESFHARFTAVSVACILCAGGLGLGLERGAGSTARTVHLICGAAGLLAALGGALAAFAILP
jgi:hypothetical protein